MPRLHLPRFGVDMVHGGWFRAQASKAFNQCDIDKDGHLDNKEIYIALLQLYDLLNAQLPYHVRVPNIGEVNELVQQYDVNNNSRFEFDEFLACCRGLVGSRKHWRDSLFLKVALVVALKAFAFPYAAGALKAGASSLGLKQAERVPTGAIAFVVETATKRIIPL